MITLSEINQAYRNASEMEKQEYINLTLPQTINNPSFEEKVTSIVEKTIENYADSRFSSPEYKAEMQKDIRESVKKEIIESYSTPDFESSVETVLATSELKVLKRISTAETVLGINGTIDYEDDERELSILEKIDSIEDKLTNFEFLPTVNPQKEQKQEVEVTPRTSLESKAVKLVEKLKVKPHSRTGEVFMDNSELTTFLKTELPEELHSKDTNIRRVKKRVIEKARCLFPESIFVNKSKYGRHETRVIFKYNPENVPMKRNGTLNLNLS